MRVLILGAGASNPAGYPLANELLYRVGESASDSSSLQFSDAWQAWESFRKSVPASLSLIAYNSIPSSVSHIGLLDAPWGPAISSLMRRRSFPRAVTRARCFKSQRKGTSPLFLHTL